MKKKATPTREEVKVARAKRRAAMKEVREANKIIFRRLRRRRGLMRVRRLPAASKEQRSFRTWVHDYRTLARAVARAPGAENWTAEELAANMCAAADRMKHEVESRDPHGESDMVFFHRRRDTKMMRWSEWQELFDSFVHDLAEKSLLPAAAVIDRSVALADAIQRVYDERRPKKPERSKRRAA